MSTIELLKWWTAYRKSSKNKNNLRKLSKKGIARVRDSKSTQNLIPIASRLR